MHVPLAGLAMQYASSPCQRRGEKGAHFWFVSFCSPERIQNKKPCAAPLNRREDGFGESRAAIWIRAIVAAQVRGTGDRQPATATPAPGGQHDRSHVRMALRFPTGLLGASDSHEFDFIFGRRRALSLRPPLATLCSQLGLTVNSLCCRVCELPRSAPRRLGFTVETTRVLVGRESRNPLCVLGSALPGPGVIHLLLF